MKKLRKIKKIIDFLKFKVISRYILIIINGNSMMPELRNKSLKVVDKNHFKINKIKRFEIVYFVHQISKKDNPIMYVKRVIGLPNEWVEIKGNNLYVNDKKINCNYWQKSHFEKSYVWDTNFDDFVVIGDNLDFSTDSRKFGTVKLQNIIGKIL